MRIHILTHFVEGPWGGGNQFLKALRSELRAQGLYADSPEEATVILFNSFPSGHEELLYRAMQLRRQGKILVHRVDGPIFEIRGTDREVDQMIYAFNHAVAHGTVFQSHWSKGHNRAQGMKEKPFETIIFNAPDPLIFYPPAIKIQHDKIRLIATSWSDNPNKGFDVYEYLDNHLDWSRFTMLFVGNAPVTFQNIEMRPAVPSRELGELLRSQDIFITASKKDPCSNSLLEALRCGLPAVALNDGGHPEILQRAGEVFNGTDDCIFAIDRVAKDVDAYRKKICVPSIIDIANQYLDFFSRVERATATSQTSWHTLRLAKYELQLRSILWKLHKRFF